MCCRASCASGWKIDPYDLYQGDSIHFRSTINHRLENLSDDLSIVFSVINPAIF